MLWGFLIGHEKGGVKYRVDLPLGGNLEAEGHVGDDFLHFKWTGAFHLEFLEPIHVEVSCLEPYFVSDFPGHKLGRYLFFHLLLSHLVCGLGIILGHG